MKKYRVILDINLAGRDNPESIKQKLAENGYVFQSELTDNIYRFLQFEQFKAFKPHQFDVTEVNIKNEITALLGGDFRINIKAWVEK